MAGGRFMDRWPVCSHAGSSAPLLFACNTAIAAASAVDFLLEIPRRTALAEARRRTGLATRFLGHAVEATESYDEKWRYVAENPVRAGLVVHSEDWPFQGEMNSLNW